MDCRFVEEKLLSIGHWFKSGSKEFFFIIKNNSIFFHSISIGLPDPPIEGLFSACALGLLHEDRELSGLVLKELNIYEDNPEYSHHVVFFKSQMFLLTVCVFFFY